MNDLFLACAVFGSTVLIVQTALTLLGITFDHSDGSMDVGHDAHDIHLDAHAPDFHADVSHDAHADASNGFHGHQGDSQHAVSLVRFLTLRGFVAFLAFFGLGGLASLEAGQTPAVAMVTSLICGFGAMSLVGYAMQSLRRLDSEGNVDIRGAIGQPARVYLRIPAANAGNGKVTVVVQGRTMEYLASTPGPALPTGNSVIVRRVLGEGTVEVVAPEPVVQDA